MNNNNFEQERFMNPKHKLLCPTCKQEYSKEGHIFKCVICWGEICDICQSKPLHKEDCYNHPVYLNGYPEFP